MSNGVLLVRGGTVVDGTGAPATRADVAIRDARIVGIGPEASALAADADDVVDADGCVVAPGFVDVHTHYDAQATWDPWLSPSSQLGVTSAVLGNCGFSVAPCRPELRSLMMRTLEAVEDIPLASMTAAIDWSFETHPQYLTSLGRRGLGINMGGYVGHTAVRLFVMGEAAYERHATDDEVAAMCAVVRDSILGGALGFSTERAGFIPGAGNRPVPSVVASAAETEALCLAVGQTGRGIVHIAPGDVFEWIYELAPRLACTLTWSAILAYPPGKPVNWTHKLGRQLEARRADPPLDVHPQVTSRVLTFSFTLENPIMLYQVGAFGELGKAGTETRRRAFMDEAWRQRARADTDALPVNWAAMIVAESSDRSAVDASVASLAERAGVHPLDAIVDLALRDELTTRLRVEAANIDPAAVTALLTGDGCILGLTDAGAHVAQLCDAHMPIHFLSEWVRDRSIMSIEDGIRKTSGEIADVVGLADRGVIRVGAFADLVVLNWERLAPGPLRRVEDLPGGAPRLVPDAPVGLRHVLVNGTVIRRDEQPVANAPLSGMLLEPKRYPLLPTASV